MRTMQPYKGKLSDPQWRKDRAVKAATARNNIDTIISKLVERAPELTDDQASKLRSLLSKREA